MSKREKRFATFTVSAPEGERQAVIRGVQEAKEKGVKILVKGKRTAEKHPTGTGYWVVKLEVK